MTIVIYVITYEYRMRPTNKQVKQLNRMLWLTRTAYNDMLQELIDNYKATGKHMNRFAQDKLHGKARHPEIAAVLVDTTVVRVQRSFENFFRGLKGGRKIGFPRFKSARSWSTLQYRDAHNALNGNYFQSGKPVAGNIRVNVHRPMEGEFKFGRIVRRPSGFYLQCVCEEVEHEPTANDKAVGVDVGLLHFVADSAGNTVENPRFLQKSLKRLAKAQKVLARRKKGSGRRKKQVAVVARIHEHITNQRKDYLHKVSRQYVNGYGFIAVEDLNISGMVQNHHLARSIADASWGMFVDMLSYKAESAGGKLVKVAPQYTSQKCSRCGEYVEKSLSVRTHICPSCGYVADRDVNAARNILRKARTEPLGSRING